MPKCQNIKEAEGWNPRHIYLGVSLTEHSDTYFSIQICRVALEELFFSSARIPLSGL